MRSFLRLAAVALVALSGACATSGTAAARPNQNVISTEEITQSAAPNAYDLIQRLRPNYLRTRGAVHGTPEGKNKLEPVDVVVYLNENRLGMSDQLRQISTLDIREIRYFNASEATTRWGTGHSAGAIQVVTR